MRLHVDMYIAADYFRIRGLQDFIIERIGDMMDDWEEVNPVLPEINTFVYEKPESITSGIRVKLVSILEKQFYGLKKDKAFCDFLKDFEKYFRDILPKAYEDKPKITGAILTYCYFCKKFIVERVDGYTPAHCSRCGKSNHNNGLRHRAQ